MARAQLDPGDRWRTLETAHFRVHFTTALEDEGRRAAVNAERAWAELSTELVPPKGKVDLVVADNVDYVNGYASAFPSNRIVIFAHPPIDAPELRNYDDWSRLVITHELVHVFHLDRARGLWALGRKIFGRHPVLFPNAFLPSWVVEGLAVYYESRVTGAGRLEGSEHYMISRSAAEVGRVPRIGELSRSTSRFPGGEVVYAYGGQIFDYLARTRGPDKVPKFVEVSSSVILPLSLNRKAKRAFGISFENAWRDWRDSLVRVSGEPTDPVSGWQELTRDGRLARFPRWLGDTAIIFAGANGRDVVSAYRVTTGGEVKRLARRNSLDANVVRPDGSIVFAQPDYIDPFHYRNDLWVERSGKSTRLTRGARIAQPDVRMDGAIVAVQSVPGSNVLVRVSADGERITPLGLPSPEIQWAEPRWSPDGASIAAIRATRGGPNELVLLSEDGSVTRVLVALRAVLATPSWSPDGTRIFFASTRTGASQAYSVPVSGGAAPVQLTNASTGFFDPEVSSQSLLAGLHFRFDGYHVGVAPLPAATADAASPSVTTPRSGCANCLMKVQIPPPVTLEMLGPSRRYSPVRSLLPTYWEPILEGTSDAGNIYGAGTGGEDIVGRHSYYAQVTRNTKYSETEGFLLYQYAGLGQPFLNFTAAQDWEHFAIANAEDSVVGDLSRRDRVLAMSASFVRPRARTFASLAVGGEIESRRHASDPDTLLGALPDFFAKARRYPSVFVSASWTNAKRPSLSISREDGFSASAVARQRWEAGELSRGSRSIVGVATAYKALDLPGFAHHVIALRGAGGYADRRAISTFSAGGLSGGSIEVLSGVSVGDERRTFGVRGFPPSAEQGIRALAGTAEYRAPISAPSRRVRFIPLLFDRISVAAFADAGRAWCPRRAAGICERDRGGPWLASAGGEVDIDTAVQYDFPLRFRLGIAVPVAGRDAVGAKAASLYFTVGSHF